MFKQLSRHLRRSQTGFLLSVLLLSGLAALAWPALTLSRRPDPDASRGKPATSPFAPSEASTKVQREVDAPQTLTREFPLTAPDGAPFDYFGKSVAISGNTAIVGADEYGTGQYFHKGKVYFFVRIAADWVMQVNRPRRLMQMIWNVQNDVQMNGSSWRPWIFSAYEVKSIAYFY